MPGDGDGPTVVVVTEGAEGEVSGEGGGATEGGGEGGASTEAVEAAAEAAVEIAAIEADRDVAVAEIHADAATEQVQAAADAVANSEVEQCRTRIAELEGQNTALRTELETLQAQLTPPPSEPLPPSQSEVEVVAVEDGPKESQEAPEPEKPKRKPHRWI